MSTESERILIQKLVAGELDASEQQEARALVERKPELRRLRDRLAQLASQVRKTFPQPPPIGDVRGFLELMGRLSSRAPELPVFAEPFTRHDVVASRSLYAVPETLQQYRVFLTDSVAPAPEPSVGAHLFNLREIPRDDGLSVELEFYAGDVLAIRSEVLLLSAFAGSYQPAPGSLFGAIADRYGISFGTEPPPGSYRYPGGLLRFGGVSCPAFDSLWVLEMKRPGQRFSLRDLRRALETVGSHLPDLLAAASSITLPLLGTGDQELQPRDVARELLSALPGWARHLQLRTVRVFTLRLEHVAILNRALDGRRFEERTSALVGPSEELQRRLEEGRWSEPIRVALEHLLQIASAPDPSMQSIALEGRRLAEAALRTLWQEGVVERDAMRADRLEAPLGSGEPFEHLELLLSQGRSAAAGGSVNAHDAAMVIDAALRSAEMTLA